LVNGITPNWKINMSSQKKIIEAGYKSMCLGECWQSKALKHAVQETLQQLDQGHLRVAEKINQQWVTHAWVKQAILMNFQLSDGQTWPSGFSTYYDKVPSKFDDYQAKDFQARGIRFVPPANARYGCHIGNNCVVMPSFINVGAFVDQGCMIDTWATIGSCAQIGQSVHISGGTGIGGVLEPLQSHPTIIEDNCFIGARSEIVEGVIVGEGSVIGMGVFIGQSTKIYDRRNDKMLYGKVPPYSVVVAGSLPSKTGQCHLQCAVIVKTVDAGTRKKVSINQLLRQADPDQTIDV
jgi:2,3,4,5-tetrahydropyridine-2-carboxylate N-succinyltransferase